MDQKISFVVDGKPATVNADLAMPLLYALHSELGLNNPKFGCGKAQCMRRVPITPERMKAALARA
jgi:aerobic-type carbon monoxide dehydrogenase small subunit (CoxS/CutS family)